jgi:hypothetical protein
MHLRARARRLAALLCVLRVFSLLLLIHDVESALAAGPAVVGGCLLACGAGRHGRFRGFPMVGRRGRRSV